MAVFKLARFEIRSDRRADAERAMHELASYIRKELPAASWTTYRDPHAPAHYISLSRADDRTADDRFRDAPGMRAFLATLGPLLVGTLEVTEYELVTSSDLAPRLRNLRRRPR
jgi:quinol monooxygenase YgiN